jgi:hypothetical protein
MKNATATEIVAPALAQLRALDSERAWQNAEVIEAYAQNDDLDGVLRALDWAAQDTDDQRTLGNLDAIGTLILLLA